MARVLVIDDDSDVRAMLAVTLSLEGYTVAEAADGIEGLERAREQRPDVILLDLMMPRMDGRTFRDEQIRDPRLIGVPVVVISASTNDAIRAVPADAHLQKPCDVEEIIRLVGRFSTPIRAYD